MRLAVICVMLVMPTMASAEGWYLMAPPRRGQAEQEAMRRVQGSQEDRQADGVKQLAAQIAIAYVTDAPLREWHRLRAFDSAEACETFRSEITYTARGLFPPKDMQALARLPRDRQEALERAVAELPSIIDKDKSMIALVSVAECVSVADPRLR